MSRKNVFLYDIDVPEIVQEKAEIAFSIIRTKGESTMKEYNPGEKEKDEGARNRQQKGSRIKKQNSIRRKRRVIGILSGMAACAAVIGIAIAAKGAWIWPSLDVAENKTGVEEIPDGEERAEENLLDVIDNMFTLKVSAAELEEGQPVPLVDHTGQPDNGSRIDGRQADSWVLGGSEESVDYCINMPLSCTGENIDKITYSINRGAFQIVQPEGESIIIDGQLYDGEINSGMIGGDYNEETGKASRDYETVFYRSFTLDYEKQTDEFTWFNICNELSGKAEIIDLIWGEGKSLEDMNRGMQEMFGNTIITCTVRYQDGTTQSADILVNSRIMTCEEAGVEAKEDPDREEIFITFELQ